MRTILLLLILCATALTATAQRPKVEGRWLIPDEKTGAPKSYIDVYTDQGGFTYAKVGEILLDIPGKEHLRCVHCKGEKKDAPMLGLVIVERMRLGDKGRLEGGTILDPDNGKVFDCRMWLDPADSNVLLVRGYWGLLYKTLRLTRVGPK